MSNSYRIRTTPGVDKSIKVRIDQEFEKLEILSLKVLQSDIYTRQCADYGVIIGRVSINNGFGVPNAKVSLFIPLSDDDNLNNPVIADLYPYKTLTQTNDQGYRYNLLPTEKSYSNHVPTGSFFTRQDVLTNQTKIEIYDKYYKLNTITNESGDYMIFGVPLGSQTIVVNVDLSDIGEFSLSPQDLIRMGAATPQEVNGTKFKSSSNLNELPQIVTINRTIEVQPFWGDEGICVLGITRTDFDLSAEKNITIQPTAIFMGSLISNNEDESLKLKCKPALKSGSLCSLVSGPGQIQAIRQTIFTDVNGRPGLEVAGLEEGGQVIDDNGAWMFDIPMNLDYVVTNEFGEQVISKDPKKGIPTKGKYRFKIMWNQSPNLGERVKRANYLVPNVKEYGWVASDGTDPLTNKTVAGTSQFGNSDNPCAGPSIPNTDEFKAANASYAFSLDWTDYGVTGGTGTLTPLGEKMVLEAINCEDRFFEMQYNKVYTTSSLISEYRKGFFNNRILAVKNILDESCESTNNKFPSNDGMYRIDIIFILFSILMIIAYVILIIVLLIYHLFMFILCRIVLPVVDTLREFWCWIQDVGSSFASWYPFYNWAHPKCVDYTAKYESIRYKCSKSGLPLPMLTYPDCELCACDPGAPQSLPPSPADAALSPNSSFADILVGPQYSGPYGRTDKTKGSFMEIPSRPLDVNYISGYYPSDGSLTIQNRGTNVDFQSKVDNDTIRTFSTDLPWHERFNLFNTKAKYFNNDSSNPGGGVNQIGVRFGTEFNGGPLSAAGLSGKYHLDNVIAVLIDQNQVKTFQPGSLFTTVDPQISDDINIFSTQPENEFGTNSITGTSIGSIYNNNPKINVRDQVEVKYANPTGGAELSTFYKLTGSSEVTYHKFSMDLEYFQVIDSINIIDYCKAVEALTPDLANSFYTRVINAGYRMLLTEAPENWGRSYYTLRGSGLLENGAGGNIDPKGSGLAPAGGSNVIQPIRRYLIGSENLQVVFMVRGVDPNSPKTTISYDLSKLYGKSTFGKKIVTLPNMRMNIPIRGGFKCLNHLVYYGNQSSNFKDPYSNQTLFYDTYFFKPSTGTLQVGPEIDPSTIKYDNDGNEIPNSGTAYNPPTRDPFYRPAGYCDFKSFNSRNFHWYAAIIDGNNGTGYYNNPMGLGGYKNFTNDQSKGLRILGGADLVIEGKANALTTEWFQQPDFCHSKTNPNVRCAWTYPEKSRAVYPYDNDYGADTGNFSNQNIANKSNRGYFHNESVEGGVLSMLVANKPDYNKILSLPIPFTTIDYENRRAVYLQRDRNVMYASQYWSYTYKSVYSNTVGYDKGFNMVLGDNGRQIVMRTDRLPSSSNEDKGILVGAGDGTQYISYNLMANNNFTFFQVSDDGSVAQSGGENSVSGAGASADSAANNAQDCNGEVLSTFSCEGLIPLDCYEFKNSKINIKKKVYPLDVNSCYGNHVSPNSDNKIYGRQPEEVLVGGCYNLAQVPFESLDNDFILLKEWRLRMIVSFAACRNVFSHYFTNNWINGTLYSFSFINSRRFTNPSNKNSTSNKAYNCYCKNNIYFNTFTNNFYYRSSPYSEANGFVGRKNPISWLGKTPYGGNVNSLMWPTTIMDLGPRDVYTQEIVYSNDYDGYVMKNLDSTTFKDVSDLLNTFIISRLINKNILNGLLAIAGVSSVFRFFSRENKKIDGDYAQMVSINSELATLGFSDENYDSCTDIFYNGGNSNNGVFGIAFKADNEIRDYITPKRNIISEELTIDKIDCAFEPFKVTTQVVPYYQWFIKPNNDKPEDYEPGKSLFPGAPADTIYGSQLNNWSTNPYSGTTFFSHKYQKLDRLNRNSRYFRTKGSTITKYYRSVIFSVNSGNPTLPTSDITTWDLNSADSGTPQSARIVNTGAPYYFYFGLNKGKTAFDRFVRKWIEPEIITD